jgi:hypothetical protein
LGSRGLGLQVRQHRTHVAERPTGPVTFSVYGSGGLERAVDLRFGNARVRAHPTPEHLLGSLGRPLRVVWPLLLSLVGSTEIRGHRAGRRDRPMARGVTAQRAAKPSTTMSKSRIMLSQPHVASPVGLGDDRRAAGCGQAWRTLVTATNPRLGRPSRVLDLPEPVVDAVRASVPGDPGGGAGCVVSGA